jgi:hypothetical protein
MEPNWRWHPITRVVAAALGLAILASGGIAIVVAVEGAMAKRWRMMSMVVVVIPALALARLFLIGAWTGEEPAVLFDDDDDPDHVT